jgi:hypothetical protein
MLYMGGHPQASMLTRKIYFKFLLLIFGIILAICTIIVILIPQCFRSWAYGKEWPWTPLSFTRACHVLPFGALWVDHP